MSEAFNWHDEAEKRWNNKVTFWNEKSRAFWETGSRSTIVPFVKKHIPIHSKIADIGCGDGYGSFKLHQAGFKVTGVDISPNMIKKANEVSTEGMQFEVGDLADMPHKDDTFDGLVAINSLEWTENPLLALEEMKRILKDDGLLCLGLLGPTAAPRQNSYRRLYGEGVICNTMMPWEFEQLAQENGWAVIDGHGVYKEEAKTMPIDTLPKPLKQALTFMWVFMLKKNS